MTVCELLTGPEKWTQYTIARDRQDRPCGAESRRAVRWCLIGALRRCYPEPSDEFLAARERLVAATGVLPQELGCFNDRASWQAVRAAIEKAGI